jgi:general secretion pathway protein K
VKECGFIILIVHRTVRGRQALRGAHEIACPPGFALVIVLWWLALLALLIMQITAASHIEMLIAANVRGSAIAEAAADGAVNEAIFQTLAHRWLGDGSAHSVRGAQSVTEVWIDNEGAKIDPNVAPRVLMQALLRTCGAAPRPAERLAAAITEWRSLDVLRPAGALSAPQYRLAGLGYIPPNKRFVSEDELGLVLGMTPGLLACVSPHLSVYSLSVPSLETTGDQVVRRALIEAYPDDAARPSVVSAQAITVIRVTAAARAARGGGFRRVAVVRVVPAAPDESFVYKILSWESAAN